MPPSLKSDPTALLKHLCQILSVELPYHSEGSTSESFLVNDEVIKFANHRHRVGALLAEAAGKQMTLPEPLKERLSVIKLKSVTTSLFQTSTMQKLENIFASVSFDFIHVKGSNIGTQLYPEPSLREAKDVDIVVSKTNFPTAAERLISGGFQPVFRGKVLETYDTRLALNKETVFAENKTGACLELHNRLFHYEPKNFTNDFLATIAKTPKISDPHYSLYIIMHGANAFWARLKWVIDLAYLADHLTIPQREAVISLAEKYGFTTAFFASLCLLERCFPHTLDEDWTRRLSDIKTQKNILALTERFETSLSYVSPTALPLLMSPPLFHEPRGLIFNGAISWPGYFYDRGKNALLHRL